MEKQKTKDLFGRRGGGCGFAAYSSLEPAWGLARLCFQGGNRHCLSYLRMTRAYLSLLKLDLKSAFYYHPLLGGAGNRRAAADKSRLKIQDCGIVACRGGVLVVYLLRLFVFNDSLIYYKPV